MGIRGRYTLSVGGRFESHAIILDLQPISDNASRPRWLVPTIELIKYSFVLHHQHGRHASQEYQ